WHGQGEVPPGILLFLRGPRGPGLPRFRPLRGSCRALGPVRPSGRRPLDFGFRNPFAAVWGTLDRDGVLWLMGEHYERAQPLSHHADHLPPNVLWYADPSGAGE